MGLVFPELTPSFFSSSWVPREPWEALCKAGAQKLALTVGTSPWVSSRMRVLSSWFGWKCWLSSYPLSTAHSSLSVAPTRCLLKATSCSSDAKLLRTLEEFHQPDFGIQSCHSGSGLPQTVVYGRSEATQLQESVCLTVSMGPKACVLKSTRVSSILVTCTHSQAPSSVLRKVRQEDLKSQEPSHQPSFLCHCGTAFVSLWPPPQ